MALRSPRFITRQVIAALITLLLVGFLAVALIFPWHLELVDITNSRTSDPQLNVDGKFSRQWTWKGMYVQVDPKVDSNLKHLYPENEIIGWGELPNSGARSRSVYVTSQVFVIIALSFGVALLLFLLFALIARAPSAACARLLRGNAKYVALVMALLTFIFAALAWTLFFRFPTGMRRDELCPSMVFDFGEGVDVDAAPLDWCKSGSIAGKSHHTDVPFKITWMGNQTVNVDAHLTWAPSIGWFACVFSTGLLLPILVIVGCIRTPKEEEEERRRYLLLEQSESDNPYAGVF